MSKEKVIKSFYSQYEKAHKSIEKNIFNIDEKMYIASRLLDRIIVLLFINSNMNDNNSNLFNDIKKTYKEDDLLNKILSFYNNPSQIINNRINEVKTITNLFPVDMFEEDIKISDEILEDVIKKFSKYNWILNDRNEDLKNQITPDILGKVFEKYINQRESGSYYTEEDTIQYINKNSIILALFNKINYQREFLDLAKEVLNNQNINNIEDLIKDNIDLLELIVTIIEQSNSTKILEDIKNALDNIKILDPTCGTGAFLVSALNLLEELHVLIDTKINTIKNTQKPINHIEIIVNIINNNLYGVDIMSDAIDIAKFRLYLKLLQNLENTNSIENINFNLKCGNTLYGRDRAENIEIKQLVAITIEDEFITDEKFNWNIEFENVMNIGGFDCVVGNPPYVEYTKIKDKYKIEEFETFKCKNIYAYTIERSLNLLNENGVIGFIVPISIVSTPRMQILRQFIESKCSDVFYSNFGDRPGTLFNGVHQKLSILIGKKAETRETNIYTSQYYHWYNEERATLFNNIRYFKNVYRDDRFYYKLGDEIQQSIINKINSVNESISNMISEKGEHNAYLNDRMTFWMKCFKNERNTNSFKTYHFKTEGEAAAFIAIMNSSLYYLFWEIISDVWHITRKELDLFKFDYNRLTDIQKEQLISIVDELEEDLENNKVYIGSKQVEYEYKHKKSKSIIDKIDMVLKEYYNFTDEEYNYIIDYGLAYRMNDELEPYLQQRRNIDTEENHHMNVIDLFSGAGGFSEGFKKAGFDVLVANEIDEMIANTHRQNHKDTLMINIGIEEFANDVENIVNKELENMEDEQRANYIRDNINNIDVIIGGPPCQGFSMAGARNRQANEFMDDPRNYLFRHYFRMIQHFEPNYFVMENVQGLESMKGGAILREIMDLFEDENNFNNGRYYLSRKIISANELGVPQARKRLIIIGSKFESINIDEGIARIKERLNIPDSVTIEEAISDLNYLESGEGQFESDYRQEPLSDYQIARRGKSNRLYNHMGPKHNEVALDRIRRIEQGQNWQDLEERDEIKSVHSGAYGRLEWNNQSTTITTRFDTPSAGRVIHPQRHRALTPREAARIQSFDDSFVFYGNKTSVGKQIGNAVPPLVAEVLANIIRDDIEKRR